MATTSWTGRLRQQRLLTALLFTAAIFLTTPAAGFTEGAQADEPPGRTPFPPMIFSLFYQDLVFARPHVEARTEVAAAALPEPSTLALFITAFGIFSYGQWHQKKYRTAPVAANLTAMAVHIQAPRLDRLAMSGKLVSGVMHDVKNALTGIRTCVDVLGYHDLEPAERTEFMQLITQEIDRLTGMAQEILELAQGQRKIWRFQTCSVKSFLDELLPLIVRKLAGRNITMQTDLRYTDAFEVDRAQMQRVFVNIIDNACDAMPDGGTLTINSHSVKNLIQFEFTDTGCGMSPELQTHFLEPFVTAGKPHGTGLGMAIVKDILEAHQARLEVQSAVGQGTTIRILLPQHLK